MHVKFDPSQDRKIAAVAHRRGVSPQDLVRVWVGERLEECHVPEGVLASFAPPAPTAAEQGSCLCPSCATSVWSRGLCLRHYNRVRYFKGKKMLDEDWLVTNGRMAPSQGRPLATYSPGVPPSPPPDRGEDTLWLFGKEVSREGEGSKT